MAATRRHSLLTTCITLWMVKGCLSMNPAKAASAFAAMPPVASRRFGISSPSFGRTSTRAGDVHIASTFATSLYVHNYLNAFQRRLSIFISPLHASNNDDDDGDGNTKTHITHLYGKTLVSIKECIAASNHYQEQQKHAQQSNEIAPKIVFIDGSWYHKPDPVTKKFRNPSLEFQTGPRLPNARYLDMDAIASSRELFPDENPKGLPHMMPLGRLFCLAMDAFDVCGGGVVGVGKDADHVIIYAKRGALFTPRIWFLFISMGHDPNKVHLMQGSLEDYMEEGGEVEEYSLLDDDDDVNERQSARIGQGYEEFFNQGILDVTKLHQKHYRNNEKQTRYQTNVHKAMNICGKQDVLNVVKQFLTKDTDTNPTDETTINTENKNGKTIIIDTRGSGYKLKGHIPSAIHLPYSKIATPDNPLMIQPKEKLKELFQERGIDYLNPNQKIILSCGSGVSVCHGFLALKELGRDITEENTRIYDGSWMEWGRAEENNPIMLPE